MNDTQQAMTRAGQQLARARWGTTKVDHLVAELRDRVDQLGPTQVAALTELVAAARSNNPTGAGARP